MDEEINAMIYKDPVNGWSCSVCGKADIKNRSNIVRHVEARHIENAHVTCEFCGNLFKNRESKRKHVCRMQSLPHTF